jgi:hypothetical protein
MLGFNELHATYRPLKAFPVASSATAVAWVVAPTASELDASVVITEATGTGTTVRDASPVSVPEAARMITVPGATAVTTPVDETVAIVGSSDVHATETPVIGLPIPSSGTADASV